MARRADGRKERRHRTVENLRFQSLKADPIRELRLAVLDRVLDSFAVIDVECRIHPCHEERKESFTICFSPNHRTPPRRRVCLKVLQIVHCPVMSENPRRRFKWVRVLESDVASSLLS